jgi:hypothetical protein
VTAANRTASIGLCVAAALAAAATLAGCGSEGSEPPAAGGPATVTATVTTTATGTESQPEVECSTAGLRLTLPEQELPEPVADVRQRVFDAAVACDYVRLEEIALEEGEGFTYSYGGDESASEFWREREEAGPAEPGPKPMRALATILTMPFTRNESGSYAWPTVYQESPGEADWQAVVAAGLYTQEQVDSTRTVGSGYLGYRTAITADGDWQFFVAGD